MGIKVILFGQLADMANRGELELDDIEDTQMLQSKVHELVPALATITYRIAVDKKLVMGNTALSNNSTVALLPPFSGG